MAIHTLIHEQKIPVSMERAWAFFSDPYNLALITPASLDFRIRSYSGKRDLHQGQVITYRVRPLWGISMTWKSKIVQARPPSFFIDQQIRGPYLLWHHQHHLKPLDGGLLMTDHIHYKVFYGALGSLINHFIVKRELEKIFEYRSRKIREIFGEMT